MLTIIYDNFVDDALTITASSEVPTMPAECLRTQDADDVMMSTELNSLVIDIAFSRLVAPDVFGIISNLTLGATIRQQLYNQADEVIDDSTITLSADGQTGFGEGGAGDDGFGGVGGYYASAMLNRGKMNIFTYDFTAPDDICIRAKYTISDPYNNDGHIIIGRLYCSSKFQFSRNNSWGDDVTCHDNSVVVAVDKYRFSDVRSKVFKWNLKFGKLPTKERFYAVMNFWLSIGITRFFIVIFDPSTPETRALTTHYVALESDPKISQQFLNQNDLSIALVEVA